MVNRQSSTVRRARTNELQELAGLLAAAFYDPVWRPYFFPDQRRRLEGLTRFFAGGAAAVHAPRTGLDNRGSGRGDSVGATWTLAGAATRVAAPGTVDRKSIRPWTATGA